MNESSDSPLPTREQLVSRLEPAGQEHLLAFWDRLKDVQRRKLASQIEQIDLELVRKLRAMYGEGNNLHDKTTPWAELAQRAESPPAVRLDGSGLPCSLEEARRTGEEALRAGKVGMVFVAGGLGTRLGFDHPKGLFRLGPLSDRSLFEILLDHVKAVSRFYGSTIPVYLMTSPATEAETRQFFEANNYFGLDPANVVYFCQSTMWALDAKGQRILMESPDSLFLGPDGHGGMLTALDRCGALADMQQRNIEYLFYAQIDNPLLQVCDPLLIGSHICAKSEMTTQVVQKRDPLERVGNVVAINGRLQMIEYSDLPEDVARRRNADGSLKLWAGNLAVHVFDLAFLTRAAADADVLPFHAARKKVACLDDQGNVVEPETPNAIRFERFIFDLLPAARQALVVEVDPAEAFAPVKNSDAEKSDTPTTARQAMMAQARRWLRTAGARVNDDVPVEINHLWALNAAELQQKLLPGTEIAKPTYFSPQGPMEIYDSAANSH